MFVKFTRFEYDFVADAPLEGSPIVINTDRVDMVEENFKRNGEVLSCRISCNMIARLLEVPGTLDEVLAKLNGAGAAR